MLRRAVMLLSSRCAGGLIVVVLLLAVVAVVGRGGVVSVLRRTLCGTRRVALQLRRQAHSKGVHRGLWCDVE